MKTNFIFLVFLFFLISCSDDEKLSDAYGNFESVEVLVSAEATGKLLSFKINEGDYVEANTIVAEIDSAELLNKIAQLNATKQTLSSKMENINAQIKLQQQQLENLNSEKRRIENLLNNNAATQKQLDDIIYSIEIAKKQLDVIHSQSNSITAESNTIDKQIEQVKIALSHCHIKNPITGTIIAKYAEEGEFVTTTKPLYKVSNLDNIILRAYISGSQLSKIKLNQKVKVIIDTDNKNNKTIEGRVTWISSSAEFTPKIIQTKEERVNLVYAIKITVPNKEGLIKIGMPGEVKF